MSQCGCGTPVFGRGQGEYYIYGGRDNPILQKPKYINGKRYIRHSVVPTKCDALRIKEGLKGRGYLATIITANLWVKRRGYELGTEKMKMWIVYVHYR